MFKTIIRQIHWFLGITVGTILALMGLTGVITAFDEDIMSALDHGVIRVEPRKLPALTPDQLLQRFSAQMPGAKPTILAISGQPGASARITYTTGEPGPAGRAKTYVDPYTGALLGQATGEAFFAQVLLLHRVLLMPGGSEGPGRHFTAVAAFALMFFVASGLYLRWPKAAASWRAWLLADTGLRGPALWRSLHLTAGTWLMLVYLMSAVSGISFSYEWWRNGLSAVLTGAAPPPKASPPKEKAGKNEAPPALDAAWMAMQTLSGEPYEMVTITVPKASAKQVRMAHLPLGATHNRAQDIAMINLASGHIDKLTRYDNQPLGAQIMQAMVPVHRGAFFGMPGRLTVVLAALLLPGFFVTGWMLYLNRRKGKGLARAAATSVGAGTGDGADGIVVAYASQSGTAEQLAWRTVAALNQGGLNASASSLHKLTPATLASTNTLLVVASTYGEGEPPDAVRSFARSTMSAPLQLQKLRYAVLALGDRAHADFCAFGRHIDSWLEASGAQPIRERVEVNGPADRAALDSWRDWLASLGACVPSSMNEDAPFSNWRLHEQRLLNAGSPGGEIWHIVLTPPEGNACDWTAGDIAEVLPPERENSPPGPRSYSISSLPGQHRLELLVRQTVLDDGRLGLASGWLTHDAPPGAEVPLRLRANAGFRPPQSDRPMLLIGAGTGLAGLRAHLAHRAEQGQKRAWLVFGERSPKADRLYEDELNSWQREGVLTRCDLVFSRGGAGPQYVQDLLMAQRAEVRDWMAAGAVIYVCGGTAMGAAVDKALREILGDSHLDLLQAEGGYCRDVY
jgi:sulfite reductase (NADPH) flavoprotein alpha-component